MRSIPLRARITLLVMVVTALMVAIVIAAGGLEDFDSSLTEDSLESAAEAVNATDGVLTEYGEDLRVRIERWAGSNGGSVFADWPIGLSPSNVMVLDQRGQAASLEATGRVDISRTFACRAAPGRIDCGSDDTRPELAAWARRAVEQRAEIASEEEGPIAVVHGFVVRDPAGREVLVRYEADSMVGSDTDITSGIDDIAIFGLPLLLLGLGAITWFSLGRALGPVGTMIDQVDRIGADSLDQRIAVPAADDELKRLATTMNRMLDRLQGASDRQRQFISDASHELRSPITATGATLDVARARPDDADWEHVAAVVDEENTRLASLVDDLLLLARMDEDAGSNATSYESAVDLEEICLVEADRPHPVEVSVRVIEPARVIGNVSTLTRAIRNLVENAAAHADTSVRIAVGVRGREAFVRVHDDGPGVPPEYAERIFERFVRVDESRVRNGTGGAGLGLAIARRVAQGHGGRLQLVPDSAAGATFELALPRAA